jgi:hypothetical protein
MTEMGQNEKPPFFGLCQLRPGADISLFDHLIGLGEQGGGNLDAERSRCLQVDDEFKLARSRNRRFGRFLTLEDATRINASWRDTSAMLDP